MNNELIQNLRYKLQKRTRRLNSLDFTVFHYALKQYWGFLKGQPIIESILEELSKKVPEVESVAEKILAGESIVFDTEIENIAASYFVLRSCVASDNQHMEIQIGGIYDAGSKADDDLDMFRSVFLEPLYDYIDEQLDDQRAVLGVLKRYKHRCEWFRSKRLLKLWEDNSQQGEQTLASDLYEYLFDQGIDFAIEPRSASGEADFVGSQTGADRLVADAKVFTMEKGKSYLISAFHQVYTYTRDFNEPFGYLVIFKLCPEDLKFPCGDQEQSVPCITHNGKTIFILVIDIAEHKHSASKRGVLRTVEIAEDELIRECEVATADALPTEPKVES